MGHAATPRVKTSTALGPTIQPNDDAAASVRSSGWSADLRPWGADSRSVRLGWVLLILTMVNSLWSPFRERSYQILFTVCAAIAVGVGILWSPDVDEDLKEDLPEQATGQGFVTSGTCQTCHPVQYDTWHRSYHRTMTQRATPSTVLGTFDDVVFENHGFRWRFERRGDEFWVEMPDPLWFMRPPWLMEARGPELAREPTAD